MESQDTDTEVYIYDLSNNPSFLTENEGNGNVGESLFDPQGVCVIRNPSQDIGRDVFLWNGLHFVVIHSPFYIASLSKVYFTGNFAKDTSLGDQVAVINTEPLTEDEDWKEF